MTDYKALAQRAAAIAGLPADWILAQWQYESAGFTSQLAIEYNNFGGIKDWENPGQWRRFGTPEEFADYSGKNLKLYKENGIYHAKNLREFAAALQRGGYFATKEGSTPEEELDSYARGMERYHNEGGDLLAGHFEQITDGFGIPVSSEKADLEPLSATQMFGTKFMHAYSDTFVGGLINLAVGLYGGGAANGTPITQADRERVKAALPHDTNAQDWVLLHASTAEQADRLTKLKLVQKQRENDIERYAGGLSISSLGTILGYIVSDPTIVIPVLGQEAFVSKGIVAAIGKLGGRTAASALSTSKIIRYAEIAAQSSALAAADRASAGWINNTEQDVSSAAWIGAIAGGGLSLLGDKIASRMAGRKSLADPLIDALDNAETAAVARANGVAVPNEVAASRRFFEEAQDAERTAAFRSAIIGDAEAPVHVVGSVEAKEAARKAGVSLPEEWQAFYHPIEKYMVFNKEALQKMTDREVKALYAHEAGVHAGLDNILGTAEYNALKVKVEAKIKKPDANWLAAIKQADSSDWEEIFGKWVELTGVEDSNVFKKAKSSLGKYLGVQATDDVLRDFVRRNLINRKAAAEGYAYMPDGSVIMNDMRFSRENAMNPENVVNALYDIHAADTAQKDLWKPLRSVTSWLESSKMLGNYYGVAANSLSNTMRRYGKKIFHDPRQRAYTNQAEVMPAEWMKKHIVERLAVPANAFFDARASWIMKQVKEGKGLNVNTLRMQCNTEVRKAYNDMYANKIKASALECDNEIIQMANHIKTLREEEMRIAKNSSTMFGGVKANNLTDKDLTSLTDELWRVVEDDCRDLFLAKFRKADDAIDFMADYASKFARRDDMAAQLHAQKIQEWEKILDKRKKNSAEPLPQKPEMPTDIELDAYIAEEARKWAVGMVDQNASTLSRMYKNNVPNVDNAIKERFPMDTSGEVQTPWGEVFSFDATLRSDDWDVIIPANINRFAGEAAARNVFGDALNKEMDAVKIELQHAVKDGHITEARAKFEYEAFENGIKRLRGMSINDPTTNLQAFGKSYRTLAYSQSGGNMALNQVGEMTTGLAYSGWRVIAAISPFFQETITKMVRGGKDAKMLATVYADMFGSTLERSMYKTHVTSRMFKDANVRGSFMRKFDAVQDAVGYASQFTSFMSQLPKLTDNMLRWSRTDTLADAIQWARGKQFSSVRNPFSQKKFAAAGIDNQMAENIKRDVKQYLADKEHPDVSAWEKENPTTFFKFKMLVDNQSNRAMTQLNLGSSHVAKDTCGTFMKMALQFKDFVIRAINAQTLRAMTNREMDDALATAMSMIGNCMVYAGLTYGRAWANYSDDSDTRNDYLQQRLAPSQLALAGLTRGVILGTLFSFPMDAYQAYSGNQAFRTTVDTAGSFKFQSNQPRTLSDIAGGIITQMPAFRASVGAAWNIKDTVRDALDEDRVVTQREVKNLSQMLPLQNWLPMVYVMSHLIDGMDLPEKQLKQIKTE